MEFASGYTLQSASMGSEINVVDSIDLIELNLNNTLFESVSFLLMILINYFFLEYFPKKNWMKISVQII